MTRQEIIQELKKILAQADRSTEIVNRKYTKQQDEISMLLSHLSLLVADLRFDAYACRRELAAIKRLLEENNDDKLHN